MIINIEMTSNSSKSNPCVYTLNHPSPNPSHLSPQSSKASTPTPTNLVPKLRSESVGQIPGACEVKPKLNCIAGHLVYNVAFSSNYSITLVSPGYHPSINFKSYRVSS
jgi:hypothetical protein